MPLAPPPLPPGYAVAQVIELQAPLKLASPVTATIQIPTGSDANIGDLPVRVCFTGAAFTGPPDCEEIRREEYGAQTLISARVQTLSERQNIRALVVEADFSGGADSLRVVTVWNCTVRVCSETFSDDYSDIGGAKFFASGRLDGYYVEADFVFTPQYETRWSRHQFSVRVHRLDPSYDGYLQVLQYVTAGTYPAEREKKDQVIDGETPRIEQLLKTVYPEGPPS